MPGPRLPDHITFTGLDALAEWDRVVDLSGRYPVEWGILWSRDRSGIDPRYPSIPAIMRMVTDRPRYCTIRTALHICGAWCRDLMEGRMVAELPCMPETVDRLQINHPDPDPVRIQELQARVGRPCIAQCRGPFPATAAAAGNLWLFDRSGGRGRRPEVWPRHPGGGRLVGYAGGIDPENVEAVIAAIDSAGSYWIDMESGVRSPHGKTDFIDLDKVEAVCAAVYGER